MNNIPYLLSKDYEKLYELVSNGAIVAGFADYSGSTLKDVVKVMSRKIKEQGYIIGCRGIAYGDTNSDNIGEFVDVCERCNLEFIEPVQSNNGSWESGGKYTIEEVRVAILQHWKKEFGSLDEEKEDESGAIRGPYVVSGFVLAAMESIDK